MDKLKRQIKELREENARLLNENQTLKRKQLQQPQPYIQQQPQQQIIFQQPQPQPYIQPPTPQRDVSAFKKQIFNPRNASSSSGNNGGLGSSSSSSSPRRQPSESLTSKSVLLKQEIVKKDNSPKFVHPVNQKQDIVRELDPFEYGNRNQFNQILPNQRNVQAQAKQYTPPTRPKPNNQNIYDDEEFARKEQEKEYRLLYEMEDDPIIPPEVHAFYEQPYINEPQPIPYPIIHHQPQPQHQQVNVDNMSYEDLLQFQDVSVPLKFEIWRKLPTSTLVEDECSICVCDIKRGEKSTTLPCEHCFHTDCIRRWFDEKHTCPTCRHDLQP